MQVFNHRYTTDKALEKYIQQNIPTDYSAILIQIFIGILDEIKIKELSLFISSKMKNENVHIIGTTTDGEIMGGEMLEKSILISFSVFRKTTVSSFYFQELSFEAGVQAATKIISPQTKVLICFNNTLTGDPQPFLNGIESIQKNIVIAGGNAGDNNQFKQTFILKDDQIYSQGIVIATLDSNDLVVYNKAALNWTPIGKELTITKAKKNIVYEIDNKPILDVYKYYFGDDIVIGMPSSIIAFPLLKHENNVDIARSIVMVNSDDSFTYAGHFQEGDKVRFALGNVGELLNNAYTFSNDVSKYPSEAIFIYSCSVRKNFFQEELKQEFTLLNAIAPTVGFFTYGEFFSTGESAQILNITTTILSLSEDNKQHFKTKYEKQAIENSTLKSLMHLVNVTEKELNDAITELQNTQEKLIISEKMASLGSLVSGIAHEVNTPLGVSLTGISQIAFEVDKVYKAYHEDDLTEELLEDSLEMMKELTQTIYTSLENAATLINSFKHIAVDQNIDDKREFNLKEYVDEITLSLKSELKRKQVQFINNIDTSIQFNSYPGSLTQIITNLILNSLKHAFTHNQGNVIEMFTTKEEKELTLHYKDNGKGISKEVEKKIFDPFFTTARGQGGSGLGMNIVYNLVVEKLHSEITIEPSNQGLHFKIKINPDMILKA